MKYKKRLIIIVIFLLFVGYFSLSRESDDMNRVIRFSMNENINSEVNKTVTEDLFVYNVTKPINTIRVDFEYDPKN